MSCRRQGMVTQEPAPDPKCKLNISSFLALPHLLDCLICAKNYVSIVLLLWMMGGWDGWGVVNSHQGVGGAGDRGGHYLIVLFLCFCLLVFHFLSLCYVSRAWELLCQFLCLFNVFFVSSPFNLELTGHRNCCVCNVTL